MREAQGLLLLLLLLQLGQPWLLMLLQLGLLFLQLGQLWLLMLLQLGLLLLLMLLQLLSVLWVWLPDHDHVDSHGEQGAHQALLGQQCQQENPTNAIELPPGLSCGPQQQPLLVL